MLVCYRYLFRRNGELRVSYITATAEEHEKLCEQYRLDPELEAVGREYMHSIDMSQIAKYVLIKEIKKEEEKRE